MFVLERELDLDLRVVGLVVHLLELAGLEGVLVVLARDYFLVRALGELEDLLHLTAQFLGGCLGLVY